MGNKMGSAASKVSRNTVQKYNAENRAHKVLEKDKTYQRVAPKHESTKKLLDDFSRGRFTVLHQKRVYTHSGTSGSKCVHQNLLLTAHAYMRFVLK